MKNSFLKDCRHWIFDMDGTLTVAVHDFDFIRQELGIPKGADILGYVAGLPNHEKAPAKRKLDQLELHFAEQVKPALGLYDLMERLGANLCNLGVVTRNTKVVSEQSLSVLGVDHYFNSGLIIGRDEAIPKPDPDGLLNIMKHWGVKPNECVMVGDYRHDLLAGKKSGCYTIHVHEDENVAWPELTDLKVSSLSELADLV